MATLSRLGAFGLSVLVGGSYYITNECYSPKFGHKIEGSRKRSLSPISFAQCAESLVTSLSSQTNNQIQQKWDHNWDSRQPQYMVRPSEYEEANAETRKELIKKVTPTAKRNIFLIRHGQYETDEKAKNHQNLTPLGRQQAIQLGKRLAVSGRKFDSMLMSTMPRAIETANLVLNQLPPIPARADPMLEEGAPYPPEPPSKNWRPRHKAAFRKYIHRASHKQKEDSWELIVCHGNVIRYFVCRALQFPPEGWLRFSIGHCSVTWIVVYPNGAVSVRGFGDNGHLPSDMVTF